MFAEALVASVMSSDIELAKPEDGRELKKADEEIRKRQIAAFVRVVLKTPVVIEAS